MKGKVKKVFVAVVILALVVNVIPFVTERKYGKAEAAFGDTADNEAVDAKSTQTIEGPYVYNLVWDSTKGSGILRCSAKTKISYRVLEGEEYTVIEGARITMLQKGTAMVLATAEESTVYRSTETLIMVSCTEEHFINDIGDLTYEFSGEERPYKFTGSSGFLGCSMAYRERAVEGADWSETAPKEIGDYFVKLNFSIEGGKEITKFATMGIVPKKLSIKGLKVATKIFDEKTNATLEGKLDGVLAARNGVTLQLPQIAFCDINAGKNKKIKVLSGKLMITGNDVSNYELKEYDVAKLTGTILKKEAVITAEDKYSTEGYDAAELTFSCVPYVKDLKGVKLSCPITKSTPAGRYKIKVSGAKAQNYKFTYVNGVYTVYENTAGDDSPDNGIIDDWDDRTDGTGDSSNDRDSTDSFTDDGNGDPDGRGNPESNLDGSNLDRNDSEDDSFKDGTEDDSDNSYSDSVFAPHSAAMSVKFSGASTDAKVKNGEIVLDRVYSNTGEIVSTGTGYEMKIRNSSWSTVLNVMDLYNCDLSPELLRDSQNGKCKVISDLKINIRNQLNPGLRGTMIIKKYIVDMETPLIQVNGIELAEGRTTEISRKETQPVEISVSALYGLTGRSILAYRLAGASDVVNVSDSCWKNVSGGKVVLSQDFEGQVAFKAVDGLGNYSIVYTEAIRVDACAPKISGIASGKVYEGSVSYSVEDLSGVQSVLLDGKVVETAGTVTRSGTHSLEAVDMNGNTRTVTFEIKAGSIIDWIKNKLSL